MSARFASTSIQIGQQRIDTVVEDFRRETAAAGRKLPVMLDEFTVDLDVIARNEKIRDRSF